MVLSASIGALGALGSSAISSLGGQMSAYRAYKFSKRLQQHQYDLNRQALREQFANTRYSLENAGYNPLLAVGSSAQGFSASASQSPSSSGFENLNLGDSALSAVTALQQNKQTKAQTNLLNEQAETEKSKRVQMDFQNAMYDVQKHLAEKDLSTYDRRFYMNLYEQFQRAENLKASSAIGMMNAETQRQDVQNRYALGKESNSINRKRSGYQNYKDWFDTKYGNPLKTAGYAWDKSTYRQQGGYPNFW